MHYLHGIIPHRYNNYNSYCISGFTGLAILGIGESAFVAVIIFIIHLSTLSLLVIVSGWFLFTHGLQTFHINWSLPVTSGGIVNALFLGFSAAMLGISGFESSSNFVEEQEQGVFQNTTKHVGHCQFF
jgi:amino acid transporter